MGGAASLSRPLPESDVLLLANSWLLVLAPDSTVQYGFLVPIAASGHLENLLPEHDECLTKFGDELHPEDAERRLGDRRVQRGGDPEREHARVSSGSITPSSQSRAVE